MEYVVAELEGTLLKDPDVFSYFMLIAFEASGLIRFGLLLALWPVIRILEAVGRGDDGLKVMVFVATAGVRLSEIEAVGRAVLPKFLLEDVDMEAWRTFRAGQKRVVVTKMPRVMVERFVKEHLGADEVVGSELCMIDGYGFATGFIRDDSMNFEVFGGDQEPCLGLGRPDSSRASLFLPLCKVSCYETLFQ